VFLLIEDDDYFDEGRFEALDALLQRTVVFTIIDILAGSGVALGLIFGLVDEFLGEFD
jgi:hypothetical protein